LTADCDALGAVGYAITALAHEARIRGIFSEIVLFLDGCRTASGREVAVQRPEIPYSGNRRPEDVKVFYGFATLWGKLAYEDKISGSVRGVFSYALLEGLRGAAADANGVIRNQSLELYLNRRVRELRPGGADQVPHIYCPVPMRFL